MTLSLLKNKYYNKLRIIISFLLLLVISVCSCSMEKYDKDTSFLEEKKTLYALVTFTYLSDNNFIAVCDNGDLIYFSSKDKKFNNYNPKKGQRAIIYFIADSNITEGYKYSAHLLDVQEILTQNIITLTDPNKDTLGNLGIEITDARISAGYLNIDLTVKHGTNIKHYFNVVDNKLRVGEIDNNYIILEFRHKTIPDNFTHEQLAPTSICFKLNEYDPNKSDKKGIILHYKNLDNIERSLTIKK